METYDPKRDPLPSAEVLTRIPADVALRENVLPIAIEGDVIVLAVDNWDETDNSRVDKLRFCLSREVRLVPAPSVDLRFLVWRLYQPLPVY